MASKPFEEKQTVKDVQPDKLPKLEKTEKHEKQEKNEKAEKESKDNKDNPDAKHKQEKDAPDTKHKQEKEKHEKEHKLETKEELLEKVHKDQETPMAQFSPAAGAQKSTEKLPQAEVKVVKEVKLEIKEVKHEKIEIKEHKHEKFEIKEIKLEKVEKLEYEGVLGGIGEPGGPVEQRLAALEAAVSQLMHFIPENLRPDLSQGALKQEPEAGKEAKPAEPKEPPRKSKG